MLNAANLHRLRTTLAEMQAMDYEVREKIAPCFSGNEILDQDRYDTARDEMGDRALDALPGWVGALRIALALEKPDPHNLVRRLPEFTVTVAQITEMHDPLLHATFVLYAVNELHAAKIARAQYTEEQEITDESIVVMPGPTNTFPGAPTWDCDTENQEWKDLRDDPLTIHTVYQHLLSRALKREDMRRNKRVVFIQPDESGRLVRGVIDAFTQDSVGVWVTDKRFEPASGYLESLTFEYAEAGGLWLAHGQRTEAK